MYIRVCTCGFRVTVMKPTRWQFHGLSSILRFLSNILVAQLLDRLEQNSVFEMFWSGFLMPDVNSSTFPTKDVAFLSHTRKEIPQGDN